MSQKETGLDQVTSQAQRHHYNTLDSGPKEIQTFSVHGKV